MSVQISEKEESHLDEFIDIWESVMDEEERVNKTDDEKKDLILKLSRRAYKLRNLLDD